MSSVHAGRIRSFRISGGFIATLLIAFIAAPAGASATSLPTTISGNTTLTAAGNPYTGTSVTISSGVTVTAEPGVIVKLTGALTVKGTLDVNGTTESPVVFTSSSDSAPGQWTGLSLQAGAGGSTLDHAEIRYAKTGVAISGAISPAVRDSSVHHGNARGIYISGGGSPEIAGNLVADNATEGIYYQASSSSNEGQINIHDNIVEGNGGEAALWVNVVSSAKVSNLSIAENAAIENNSKGIQWQTGASKPIPPELTETSTVTGNKLNGIWLEGRVEKSTAWKDNGYAFVINGDTKVMKGSTLTLEPGVAVKGTSSSRLLYVGGGLNVKGSAIAPVVLTSIKDDSAGGDTNGDGASTSPASGQWGGINVEAGAEKTIIDKAEVRYATTGVRLSGSEAETALTDSTVKNSSSHGVTLGPSVEALIEGNLVKSNGGDGLYAASGTDAEIAANTIQGNSTEGIHYEADDNDEGVVNIHDNLVEGNGGTAAIYVTIPYAEVTGISLSGNTVKGNSGKAIQYNSNWSASIPPDIDENPVPTGNGFNALWLGGYVVDTTTWEDPGYPIVIASYGIRVDGEGHLTLGKGMVFKGAVVAEGITNGARLTIEGTEEEPVVFTSIKDDSIGGDTNADGSATKPAPNDWRGLYSLVGSDDTTVDHADVRFAKNGLRSESAVTGEVTNSRFADSSASGLSVQGAITIAGNEVVRSGSVGISLGDGGGTEGTPDIAENEVKDSGSTGIEFYGGGGTAEVNIHDNVVEDSLGKGILVDGNSYSDLVGLSLGGNEVTNSSGIGIKFGALHGFSDIIPPDIDENVLSNNDLNGIWLWGTVATSTTWEDRGYPFVVTHPNVSVQSGATLTLGPGVTVKAQSVTSSGMNVSGALTAIGTEEQPIVFTSIHDDSVDGDTGGDGSAVQPAPGSWGDLAFASGTTKSGTGSFKHVKLRFASTAVTISCPCPTPPTVRYSLISQNEDSGISVNGGDPGAAADGGPLVAHNKFRENTTYAVSKPSGTQSLWAPFNDWNCASGPRPLGCGERINGKVNWTPAAGEEGDCQGKETKNCKHGADPVVLATGNLTYSHRDLQLSGKGAQSLEFVRTYNSGDSSDASLGVGWAHNGLINATELETGDVLIRHPDGRTDLFTKVEGEFIAPSGVTDMLALVEGTFRLTTLDQIAYDFRTDGRIASITDDHGLKTTYGYDGNGRLSTITDASGQVLTFSYNASNYITKVADSTGREAKFTYSETGDLATVTDALGGITKYTYDAEHRLKTITDPRENVILQNTYDGQGRVVEQLDGLENLWTLEYKASETIVTEPEGGERTYVFDGQGRVISETDQLGHTTTTGYDEDGNVDEIVRPGGAKWEFDYDASGNLSAVVDPEEGERSYEYDGQNRLTSFTDEREETWSYKWDEDNDLIKVTDPIEGETTATYDVAGQPLTITDPNERTTTFTYDSRGNRLTAENALEHTTTLGYNSRNHLTSETLPGLEPETYGRNALGELTFMTTPEGHKTEYSYDANGMLTQITDPAEGVWEIERNPMERPTAYVDPSEQRTEIDYDGNLNPVKVTDRRGKETTYSYDPANQVIGMVRPEGGDWEFDYDARGNRIELIEPRENATTYEYDLLDRMTGVIEPLEDEAKYFYDASSNLTFYTDPRENTTGLVYDELGRLTQISQPLEKVTSFTYDGVGNRLSRSTANGTVSFDYDAANRLHAITTGESTLRDFSYDAANRMVGATDIQGDELEIGYDDDGNVIAIDDDRGQTVAREFDSRGNLVEQTDGRGTLEYGYDKLGQMTSLTDPQSKVMEFGYDPEGNLAEVELPNGVETTNEYDDAGRLIETNSLAGESILESLEYEYDPFGNRIAQTDRLSQETIYSYDALNRLTGFDPPGEGSTEYDYDAAGNRTQVGATTYSFNALNQLASASDGTTYDYDDDGRLVEVAKGEEGTTYDWNALDELTGVGTGAGEVTYSYDALGRQVSRDDGSPRMTHYGDLSVPLFSTPMPKVCRP